MKTKSTLAAIRVTLSICLLSIGISFCGWVGGCAGKGQLNPATGVYDTNATASQVVVAAENIRATALEIFDAFMQIERSHEVEFRKIDPQIHEFAEQVRRDGAKWLDDLTAAKRTYQGVRTPGALGELNAALAAVNVAVARANKYLLPQALRPTVPTNPQ